MFWLNEISAAYLLRKSEKINEKQYFWPESLIKLRDARQEIYKHPKTTPESRFVGAIQTYYNPREVFKESVE